MIALATAALLAAPMVRVEVTLVNSDGGPVNGTPVRVYDAMTWSGSDGRLYVGMPDASGRVSWREDVLPLRTEVVRTLRVDGYEPTTLELNLSRLRPETVTLKPLKVLRGQVIDTEGQPVAGHPIYVESLRLSRTQWSDLPDIPRHPAARTDAEGRFEVPFTRPLLHLRCPNGVGGHLRTRHFSKHTAPELVTIRLGGDNDAIAQFSRNRPDGVTDLFIHDHEGRPLAYRASLIARSGPQMTVTADTDGHATLSYDPNVLRQRFQIDLPHVAGWTRSIRLLFDNAVKRRSGRMPQPVNVLRLPAMTHESLRLLDDLGEPLEGIGVRLKQDFFLTPSVSPHRLATNGEVIGEFIFTSERFGRSGPGGYLTVPVFHTSIGQPLGTVATLTTEARNDRDGGLAIDLTERLEKPVGVLESSHTVTIKRPSHLTVQVRDADGQPVLDATVRLTARLPSTRGQHPFFKTESFRSETEETGVARLPAVQPQNAGLSIYAPEFAPYVERVDLPPGLSERSVTLQPATQLRVRVLGANGKPPLDRTLVPVFPNRLYVVPAPHAQPQLDADGVVTWDSAPRSDELTLRYRLGSGELLGSRAVLAAGDPLETWDARLGAFKVEGYVIDDATQNGMAGVGIDYRIVNGEHPDRWLVDASFTDHSGKYSLLVPGAKPPPVIEIRPHAEGYDPTVSREIVVEKDRVTRSIRLQPGTK